MPERAHVGPSGLRRKTLRTRRLVLEPVRATDAQRLHAHLFSQPSVMRFWENSTLKRVEEVTARVERWCRRWDQELSWWTISSVKLGAFIGAVGFGELAEAGDVEIAYLACEQHWGRGLMTEAVAAACQFAAAHCAGVFATVHPDNAASRRLLDKCGFEEEGAVRRMYGQERLVFRWRAPVVSSAGTGRVPAFLSTAALAPPGRPPASACHAKASG